MSDAYVRMQQDYNVIGPKQEPAFPVLESEWTRLRDKISKIDVCIDWINISGSIFLGTALPVAITAYFGLVSPTDKYTKEALVSIHWILFALFLSIGVLLIVISYFKRVNVLARKEDAIEHMNVIHSRYKN